MELFGTDGSPYVRKVRIVFEEKGIPYDFVHTPPSIPGSRVPQVNPLGKVPALLRDDGKALYDSPVIVEYLDGLKTAPRLIPDAFDDRIEVKRWEALADGIADATVAISHEYRKETGKQESAEWYQKQRQKIERGLAVIAKDLSAGTYCYRDTFSLADIAVGYALGYLDRVLREIDWRTPYPTLKRLAERLETRDSFRNTLPAAK